VFFVGGILLTLSLAESPSWFLLIPYYTEFHAGAALGLALIVSGVSLAIFGIVVGIHYSRDRGWYMRELHKANSLEDALLRSESTKSRRKRK